MRVSSGGDAENRWRYAIRTTLLSLTTKEWKAMKQMLEKWGEGGLFVSEDREVPAPLL